MAFFGEFDHKIDPKGRINLPAKYKDDFRDGGFVCFLTPLVAIFTPDGWADYRSRLRASGVFSRDDLQVIMGMASEFTPDSQNRIVLNAKTRENGGLGELITVVGAEDYLAIWDRDKWIAKQASVLAKPAEGLSLEEKFSSLDFA